MQDETPRYLYKVISNIHWKASEFMENLALSVEDDHFVHFSTEDQLGTMISKCWIHAQEFVVLKIDATKLPGKLVYKTSPEGTNQYYHLYEGFIPREAIIESHLMSH